MLNTSIHVTSLITPETWKKVSCRRFLSHSFFCTSGRIYVPCKVVFTCMPYESWHRQLRSLLCFCHICWLTPLLVDVMLVFHQFLLQLFSFLFALCQICGRNWQQCFLTSGWRAPSRAPQGRGHVSAVWHTTWRTTWPGLPHCRPSITASPVYEDLPSPDGNGQ